MQHYWILDAEARRIECFRLVASEFEPLVQALGNEVLRHEAWGGLEIDLEPLWRPSPAPTPQDPGEDGSLVLLDFKPESH